MENGRGQRETYKYSKRKKTYCLTKDKGQMGTDREDIMRVKDQESSTTLIPDQDTAPLLLEEEIEKTEMKIFF